MEPNTPTEGQAVVIVRGQYAKEPGVVVAVAPHTADVLLARSGDRVTVRHTSLELY